LSAMALVDWLMNDVKVVKHSALDVRVPVVVNTATQISARRATVKSPINTSTRWIKSFILTTSFARTVKRSLVERCMVKTMTSRIVRTVFKNFSQKKCDACGRPCGEQAFEVSGKHFHDTCLVCCTCGTSLASVGIAEHDNKMFCENCFGSKHGKLCAGCGTLLKQQGIQALDVEWHPNCFKCQVCNKALDPGSKFVQKDGKLLCMADYGALHATRCSHCNKPILEKEYYKHEKTNKAFHRDCAGPAGLKT